MCHWILRLQDYYHVHKNAEPDITWHIVVLKNCTTEDPKQVFAHHHVSLHLTFKCHFGNQITAIAQLAKQRKATKRETRQETNKGEPLGKNWPQAQASKLGNQGSLQPNSGKSSELPASRPFLCYGCASNRAPLPAQTNSWETRCCETRRWETKGRKTGWMKGKLGRDKEMGDKMMRDKNCNQDGGIHGPGKGNDGNKQK